MSGEVLKPCPICGKKVSIARTDNEVGERWWFITRGTYKTTRCNCRLFLESEKFTCGWNDDYSLECRAKLIDKWNTRAECSTLTVEQGSEREKQLEELVRDAYWLIVRAVWTHESQDKFASEWNERVSVLGIEVD